ncbi:uncharacterized protein EV420DRAFT_1646143 [Desarmillaria tabescens]|uniref:Uncharacterized protein n=1 Tax=Armillaria tabescens TaxID=1929756 RepID=A0AA39MYA2_ARMTA|nr:uncharacterized protein EV420DRAFT_1646143 [Desarmillaria tabescens]KAK0451411.1 hypothetical protein EV420DRAFT_1646143 [Desarmillaria tabescens]
MLMTETRREPLNHLLSMKSLQCLLDAIVSLFPNTIDHRNPANLLKDLKITLKKANKSDIVLTLGDIIDCQRGLVGRNICVITTECPEWPEKRLADAAKVKADEMAGQGERHWVLDHLPEIFHSQDFSFDNKDLPWRKLMELLRMGSYVDGKTLIYEEHLLRITMSEHLFPMMDLANVKDIAQAFLDILQCISLLFLSLASEYNI